MSLFEIYNPTSKFWRYHWASYPLDVPKKCPNAPKPTQRAVFLVKELQLYIGAPSSCLIWKAEPSRPTEENHFGHFYPNLILLVTKQGSSP